MRENEMTKPLREIVARPSQLKEELECGHIILRPLGLGEFAMEPGKAQRRRCYLCPDQVKTVTAPRERGAPAEQRGLCSHCGKKGLGNTYFGRSATLQINGAYRQCCYCGEHSAL
jgi:hypothetical protein